jgi:hypothetical protein
LPRRHRSTRDASLERVLSIRPCGDGGFRAGPPGLTSSCPRTLTRALYARWGCGLVERML